jgi:hypothetical protein
LVLALADRYRRGPSAAFNLRGTECFKAQPSKIRAYTTFAAKWLIPRLPSFYVSYPEIKLDVSNVVAPINFERDTSGDATMDFMPRSFRLGVICRQHIRDRQIQIRPPETGCRVAALLRRPVAEDGHVASKHRSVLALCLPKIFRQVDF